MTRSAARAVALCCIYESGFHETPIEEILDDRVGGGYLSLAGEDALFDSPMTKGAASYIRDVVTICHREGEALSERIAALSVDWDKKRISRVTMAILRLALTEIMFRADVPVSTAINEAVILAKKFDTEKAPAFINGILGTFAASCEGDPKGNHNSGREGE